MKIDLRDEVKVTLVAVLSIIAFMVLANYLNIDIDFISYLIPMVILIIYFIIVRDKKGKNFFTSPFFWSIIVVLVTTVVFLYYFFK
ncbi:hypothetical protein ACFLQQ_00960 [Actinomycetota bacterium]